MSVKKTKKQSLPVANVIASKTKKQPVHTETFANPSIINPTPQDESSIALKEETLRWIFSIIGALLCYLVVATIIQKTYHPDINELLALANKLSFAGDARPEPVESLLFRSGVVTITLGMLGFYILFTKTQWVKKLADNPFFLVFSTLCVAFIIVLGYLDFSAQNPFANGGGDMPQHARDFIENKSNFAFYFDGIFLGSHLLIYTLICVPLVACLFFIGIKKYSLEKNKVFNISISAIGYLVAGGTVLAVVLMDSFAFPYSFVNKYNFNAVYYSMTQVYAGMPMLVDGFNDTYGLYPHFLNLLFHIIGLSVFKFSCTLATLLGISYIFNFYFLKQFVSNKIILFLGFLSVIFFPFLDDKFINSFDCIFGFFPIRYLVPSTLTFLAGLYLVKRSQVVYWVTFFVMAAFILWNPEFGMVCYLSWLLFNTYNDFYTSEGKVNIKKILLHWAIGFGVVVFVFFTYKFLVYVFYGAMPDFNLLFGIALAFGKVGFGCLPMKLVHPWNLMALVDILGILYAITKWYKKEITPKSSVILLVSVISLGFFVYFQGRSHNCCLATSSCFSFVLLTILGDELWEKIKSNNIFSLNLLFGVFLFVISFSFFEIIFGAGKFNELIYQEDDKSAQQAEQQHIENNSDFILQNSREKEKIYVFATKFHTGLYFNSNKRISAFNPGPQDMFLNTDLDRFENRVIDSSFDIFLEPSTWNNSFMARPLAAMAATYDFKKTNQSMSLLVKRNIKMPLKTFFGDDGSVLHRKYTDDTAGIKLRVKDAFGNKPVSLKTEFSVEALFYAQPQVYPYATIAGNMDDTSGFLIANVLNTKNYAFGINGKTFVLALPENQWVYCVLNIYPDHMEIYENGNLAASTTLPAQVHSSPEQLFIGNLGGFRFYIGAISEICITDKALDKNRIQQTWENIKGL